MTYQFQVIPRSEAPCIRKRGNRSPYRPMIEAAMADPSHVAVIDAGVTAKGVCFAARRAARNMGYGGRVDVWYDGAKVFIAAKVQA